MAGPQEKTSGGVYRFPLDRAAAIALEEIKRFLEGNKKVERVLVVCYTREVYDAYQAFLQPNEFA
jgi:O-acetyl-ADP-ribose deacetylase (regulator of RNase III)